MFVNTPEDLASRDRVLSMSGRDFMEAVRDGQIPEPPIGRILNYRLVEVDDGRGRSTAAGTARFWTVRWPVP